MRGVAKISNETYDKKNGIKKTIANPIPAIT
jgi:hypothetical protein